MAAGNVAGPALAGVLVAAASPGWALAVDSASFGVSAIFLALLHLPPHERVPVKPFLHELGEGWREVTSRSLVWSILIFAGIANMAGNVFFIVGAYVAKTELGGASAWALIATAVLRPLVMAPAADPLVLPERVPADLFFAFWIPATDLVTGGAAFLLSASLFLLLLSVPWWMARRDANPRGT